MAWFRDLITVAASKLRELFPLPDDFPHVRQRVEFLISSLASEPDKEKLLMVQVFHLNPRMFEEWKTATYDDLQNALKATTRTERRKKLRELVLLSCEMWNLANVCLEADDPGRKACALRILDDSLKTPDEAEAKWTFVKAGAELSMLILRKLEDEAYPESRGDMYLRAYLDADAVMANSGVDLMLCKERGEDAQMAALSFDVARKVTQHLKDQFLSGVTSTYSPPKT